MNRRKHDSPLTPPARERLLDHEGDGGKARGRPPKLKPEQAAAVLGRAGEEPRSRRRLCGRVEREFRIRVSPGAIGRLPKKTAGATSA